jgi:hypothetical protein
MKQGCRRHFRFLWLQPHHRVTSGPGYLPGSANKNVVRARIFKLLRSPRIDSEESIPPAFVAWRAGTTTLFLYSVPNPHRLFRNSSTDLDFQSHFRRPGAVRQCTIAQTSLSLPVLRYPPPADTCISWDFFVTSGSKAFSDWKHGWTCSDMSSLLQVPDLQRLKARVELLGYVFVTSGSQAFSACWHGWTCSDIGTYLLRHFRFPGIQRLQARVDLLGYVFVTSGSQAFSAYRHSWTCLTSLLLLQAFSTWRHSWTC